METKKYWIRFTLLTLLPIFIGVIVGLLVVRFGHRNCSDIASLEKCEQAYDTIFAENAELRKYQRFGKDLYSVPTAAEIELRRLKDELAKVHKHNEASIIDSIVDASLRRMGSHFPKTEEMPAAADMVASLNDFYRGKATQMGWSTKSLFRGDDEERKENEYILTLEQQLVSAQDKQLQAALDLKEKKKTITDLRIQLQENREGLPPQSTPHVCDHSACQEGINAAVCAGKIQQLEEFVVDLDELNGLTTNWFDRKLRDSLEGKKKEYLRLIDALEARLVISDR